MKSPINYGELNNKTTEELVAIAGELGFISKIFELGGIDPNVVRRILLNLINSTAICYTMIAGQTTGYSSATDLYKAVGRMIEMGDRKPHPPITIVYNGSIIGINLLRELVRNEKGKGKKRKIE